jgi:hypothetical protein
MIRLFLATAVTLALGPAVLGHAAMAQTTHHPTGKIHGSAAKQRAEALKPLKGIAFLLGSASACGVIPDAAAQDILIDKFTESTTTMLKLNAGEKQNIDSIFLTAQHDAVASGDCSHWHKDTALTAAILDMAKRHPSNGAGKPPEAQ